MLWSKTDGDNPLSQMYVCYTNKNKMFWNMYILAVDITWLAWKDSMQWPMIIGDLVIAQIVYSFRCAHQGETRFHPVDVFAVLEAVCPSHASYCCNTTKHTHIFITPVWYITLRLRYNVSRLTNQVICIYWNLKSQNVIYKYAFI